MSSFLISSSTTSLWYRISFSAAMASSSGDLMRVGPKTIPRFSAFIRFSFSWRVTLQKYKERGGWLCAGHGGLRCAWALSQKQDSQERFTPEDQLCRWVLPLYSASTSKYRLCVTYKTLANNGSCWWSLKLKPELMCWPGAVSSLCGFSCPSLGLLGSVCKLRRDWVISIIPPALSPLQRSGFLQSICESWGVYGEARERWVGCFVGEDKYLYSFPCSAAAKVRTIIWELSLCFSVESLTAST